MMRPSPSAGGHLCREAVDFRKGLQALAVLVESQLNSIPSRRSCLPFGTGVRRP